jgi:septal ring factor EnvC (AmiA/AmiB activator)
MSMRAFQTETQQSFNQLKQEFNEVTQRLHALQREPRVDREEIAELEAQRAALEEGQVSCAVMTAQAKSMRSNQTISEIVTSGESKVHIGMSESVAGKVNQRITKVTTETGSRAVIGNFGNDYRMSDF